MIIKDINGNKLRLTKKVLTEVTGEAFTGEKWSVKLIDLKNWEENGLLYTEQPILFRNPTQDELDFSWILNSEGKTTGWTVYKPRARRIGCRKFDKSTWAILSKAIKEAK